MTDDAPEPPARKTPAERAAAKRQEKLDDIQEQVDEGRLTIRKLSDEEMAAFEKRRAERGDRGPRRKRGG
jgi:hypothetical protein